MIKYRLIYIFIFSVTFLFNTCKKHISENIDLQNLRCEMLTNPEGIDARNPRLSWEIISDQRNIFQTAYQILVSSTLEELALDSGGLWNSGIVKSDQSIHISYNGIPLKSRMNCYWKVRIQTKNGYSDWSQPAHWSMGLLNYKDWQGRWIGLDRSFSWDDESKFSRLSARYFRKEFESNNEIKRAMVYIVGLGLYELYINGQCIGDQVLSPSPTDYTKNVKYNTYDVTQLLNKGKNVIGIILGNGRYYSMRQAYKPYKIKTFGYPKMLLNLVIEYADGTIEVIKTDNTWKVTIDGPIRSNNEYDGEEYDARKEISGWNNIGFNDNNWLEAEYVQEPGGEYEAQMNENMKVMETIKPLSIKLLKPGIYILDMGQNMVGWIKMKVIGRKGDKVTLRFAEILQENGELFVDNLRDAKVTDIYILKGDKEEIWEPSFIYHGFRYTEISGYPGIPTIDDFEGQVVYDDMKTIGYFETSNSTINQIYKNAYWGIRGNYKGMPVDCPQRNERQPWLGDRAAGCKGESFIFDNSKLYAKWLDDIKYAQKKDGSIPDVAPAFWRYYSDNMTWPGTYLMAADMLYNQYGDVKSIEEHYQSMRKWLEYMRERYMENYIIIKDTYGDWCAPPKTIEAGRGKSANKKNSSALISTAYYNYFLQIMQQFAELTGNDDDINEYQTLAEKIKNAFNNKFFKEDSAYYYNNSLTHNLLPLYFGIVPENRRDEVFEYVVKIIEVENNEHLSTGLVGTQWLMRTLTEFGRPDLAYKIATNTTYPSWGYMVENGATTIWELWNGNTAAPSMNSYNHVMLLGDLVIWFYENLAGIKTDPEYSGFKQIIMNPSFIEDLDYVKGSYHSIHGLIKSEWEKENDKLKWTISIPANIKALVYFPAKSRNNITENNINISLVDGIKYIKREGDRLVFKVGSGEYSFDIIYN